VLEGSARSSKTWSIMQYLILRCASAPNFKVTACRQKLTWAKASIVQDFEEIMRDQMLLWQESCWNKTESTYYFRNGSELSFVGLDEFGKLQGRKQHIAWVNEAIQTTLKAFRQLSIRTTEQIILDYNPSETEHWIYRDVLTREDCAYIHSTYKDNDFLEPNVIAEIERLKDVDEVLWKIYGLGQRGAHKGLIFPKYELKPFPDDAKEVEYGMDFGFTNDPTTLVKCGILHGELYVKELLYKTGLTNIHNANKPHQPSIQKELERLGIKPGDTIWADSAEPKSITEIRHCGFLIKPCMKGPDSVMNGLDNLRRYKLNVDPASVNLLKELANYKYKEDADGNILNEPIDAFNHAIDAMRYAKGNKKIMPSIA